MREHLAGAIAPVGAYLCAITIGLVSVPIALSYPTPPVKSQARMVMGVPSYAAIKTEPKVTVMVIEPSTRKLGPLTVEPIPFVESPSKPASVMSAVDDYLCEVYRRTPTKKDGAGDFTWKDKSAASRLKMDLCGYVIAGMNKDFREQLYAAGKAMDRQGIKWSMLSAFRDDYRQTIAAGLKARTGNSLHGGSRVTGGHGDGRAVDIAAVGPIGPVLKFIDTVGAKFGLYRPYKGFDPQHVQPTGAMQKLAAVLRTERAGPEANKIAAAQDKSKHKVAGTNVKKTKVAKRYKAKKTRYAKHHRVKHRYASRA